jgi:hypothetical protein
MSGEWVDDHSEPILHFFNAEKNPVMGFNQRLSEVEDRLLAVIQAPIAIMRKLGSG